jgi:MoaA/NifB/PqqE/SkfB family radical SAM enzyme
MKKVIEKNIDCNKIKEMGFDSIESYTFPRIININVLTGKCYCKCIHCPVGITEVEKREKRFNYHELEFDLYKKISDEIENFSIKSVIRIHSVGEPIIWKNIKEAVRYSNERKITTWLFTCAVTEDYDLLMHLCDNVKIIEISVNSITREDYKKNKGIDAFNLVFKNIRFMKQFIKKKNLKTRLIASRVESENKEFDEEFKAYWKGPNLFDDVFIRTYHTYNDILEHRIITEELEQKANPCLVHWARFNVNVDGNVVVCFNELFKNELKPSLILGNVYNNTIREIWQSEKLNAIRKAELSNNYSGLFCEDDLPCKNCYSCQPLYGSIETSEAQIKNL